MSPLTIQWTFPTSNSLNFPQILDQAKLGRFEERRLQVGKRHSMRYTTTFTFLPDLQGIAPVLAFAECISQERRAKAIINGIAICPPIVASVLSCYQNSLQCADPRSYCWIPIPLYGDYRRHDVANAFAAAPKQPICSIPHAEAEGEAIETALVGRQRPFAPKWLFPCRIAQGRAYNITHSHPSSLRHQAEAVLVHHGCAWCPQLRLLDEWEHGYGGRLQRTDEPQRP